MARDEDRDAKDLDDSGESNAADEPTAVWDLEALRKAGLGDLADLPEAPERGPATPAGVRPERPSIIINSGDLPGRAPGAPPPANAAERIHVRGHSSAPPQRSGVGWGTLLALSLLIGAAAYAVMRFLR